MKQTIRKDEILELLNRYGYVTVEFLAEALYVSPSSIRRDLARLEAQGLVRRSHGGVHSLESRKELTPYSLRMRENTAAKRLICEKAAALVSDGDVVFIDGSTTCLFLPELLEQKKNITVLTNSLHLAGMFEKSEGVTVYCTGGSLRLHGEMVMAGPIAEQICAQMHTNLMFFSARAVDERGVITDLNEPETSVRRVAMRHTDKAIFLCDQSKFGKSSTFTVGQASDLAYLITDASPEKIDVSSWGAPSLSIQ